MRRLFTRLALRRNGSVIGRQREIFFPQLCAEGEGRRGSLPRNEGRRRRRRRRTEGKIAEQRECANPGDTFEVVFCSLEMASSAEASAKKLSLSPLPPPPPLPSLLGSFHSGRMMAAAWRRWKKKRAWRLKIRLEASFSLRKERKSTFFFFAGIVEMKTAPSRSANSKVSQHLNAKRTYFIILNVFHCQRCVQQDESVDDSSSLLAVFRRSVRL